MGDGRGVAHRRLCGGRAHQERETGVQGPLKGEVQQWDRGRSSIKIKSRFQLETTIRNDSLYFFVMFSKFI